MPEKTVASALQFLAGKYLINSVDSAKYYSALSLDVAGKLDLPSSQTVARALYFLRGNLPARKYSAGATNL